MLVLEDQGVLLAGLLLLPVGLVECPEIGAHAHDLCGTSLLVEAAANEVFLKWKEGLCFEDALDFS